MVGYNETKGKTQLSELWQGIAGVLSGMITRLLCQPLDVLKIRFQLQHEPLLKSKGNYYWSMKQASLRILREESVAALWKGHVPAQLLSGAYGLAQFGSFELMTKIVFNVYHGENNKTVTHSICGGLSGGLATAITMPFDTIRTRLVGQGEPKIYRGISHACLCMIREEGVTSLYKGLAPNLIQIVPHTGMQFGFFQLFSNLYRYLSGKTDSEKLPMYANLIAGSGAGLLAKAGIYPLDLAKKRLQVQGFEIARSKFGKVKKYYGLRHCIALTWKEEGTIGLYKGFLPSTVKAMLTTGLIFTLYEEITQIFISLKE
ncbi:unnamed protein product [Orchesella dallaii]|uniref:Mitochondrial thiamine pyrophosphate carrier n=1 Tax=Orchesella dallaii TaxID=48710 RepID=A0ABP1Q2B9_9HEXA